MVGAQVVAWVAVTGEATKATVAVMRAVAEVVARVAAVRVAVEPEPILGNVQNRF
jgi:hypothetical protein